MTHKNTILLGIYSTNQFKQLANEFDTYPFYDNVPVNINAFKIIDFVEVAAFNSRSIIFVLDDIEYSKDKGGVTWDELMLILSREDLLEKTIFTCEGNEVALERVVELYGKNK